jgi:hypothetical protein
VMQAVSTFESLPGNAEYQRLNVGSGDWVSSDGESYWTSQWYTGYADIVNYTANTPMVGPPGNHDSGGSVNGNGYSATLPKYYPQPYTFANLVSCVTSPSSCGLTASTAVDSNGNTRFTNIYGSFDYGPVHFAFVDDFAAFTPTSTQGKWLANDLATARANKNTPWIILGYHEPAWSAGSDSDDPNAQQYLEPLVAQYNIDLVLSGHSHNYARTGVYSSAQMGIVPKQTTYKPAPGVPHITSGGGGAPIYQADLSNNGSYPYVITGWTATEFTAFSIQGNTMQVTTYQVNSPTGACDASSHTGSSCLYELATPPQKNAAGAYTFSPALTFSPIESFNLYHFSDTAFSQNAQVPASSGYSLQATATLPSPCPSTAASCTVNLTLKNTGVALKGNVDVVLDNMVNLLGIGNADNEYSYDSIGAGSGTNVYLTSKIAENNGLVNDLVLTNATSNHNGEPLIRISNNGLAAGASITVPLKFVGGSQTCGATTGTGVKPSCTLAATATIGETVTAGSNGSFTVTTKNNPNTSPANAPITVNPIVYQE